MQKLLNIFKVNKSINYKNEILSGLTVAIALIPEAVAFALIAQLSPITGLYAAFMVGLITSVFGGRPGMISGATGAIAVVIAELAINYGVEYVYAAIILAGLLQVIAGLLKLGKFMRLVPQPVIYGFVNGLAIIIFMSQLDHFKDNNGDFLVGTPLYIMIGLVLLTMFIIWGLPKIFKTIPSSLVAIIVIAVITTLFGIDTKTVGDLANIKGSFPPFHIANVPFSLNTLIIIFPYAIIVCGVGLIESLLTLNIIDEITKTKGKSNKEAIAQGSANILSGLFSGMGGCAMIGQSLINISSGARARLSGIIASVTLLAFIMFGADLIGQLPLAALVGLMFMVSIGTFEWASFKVFTKMPKSDIFVMLTVTIITAIVHNLALDVIIGVIISCLVFAWDNAKRIRARKFIDKDGVKHYQIYGPLFFGSTSAFMDKFDIDGDPKKIIIDFSESRIVDMSAIETLNKITEKYLEAGKSIKVAHLSADCIYRLKNASKITVINLQEDPTYKIIEED